MARTNDEPCCKTALCKHTRPTPRKPDVPDLLESAKNYLAALDEAGERDTSQAWVNLDKADLVLRTAIRAEPKRRAQVRDLVEAANAQHEAIDRLFALLIEATRGKPLPPFMPSKSGQPWEACLKGNKALEPFREAQP